MNISKVFNGKQAVELVNKQINEQGNLFDIIFMDQEMPIMSGLEATKEINLLFETYSVPHQ